MKTEFISWCSAVVIFVFLVNITKRNREDNTSDHSRSRIANASWFSIVEEFVDRASKSLILREWGGIDVNESQPSMNAKKSQPSRNTNLYTLPGGVKLTMKRIPAGTFMMGSPANEPERNDNETPHRVTITRDFWLGETEVTQAQWKAVMGNNPSEFKKGGNYPVEQVSWDDAMAFCKRLNDAGLAPSGWRFDLPTEAQWEYACRAGTTTAFHFGTSLNGTEANCAGDNPYGTSVKGPHLRHTCAVKRYRPNAWGLYDMHGNVWEWCRDLFGGYGGNATDPEGPSRDLLGRVHRGGGWLNSPVFCRAANRNFVAPRYHDYSLGFRLALVHDP